MTDQNTAYRNDLEQVDDSDPLAELARIVSGEPAPNKQEPASVNLEVVESKSPDGGFDIEDELMRELGGSPAESSAHVDAPTEALSDDFDFDISDEDFAAELQADSVASVDEVDFVSEASAAGPVEEEASLSLEDQLMAELDGGVAAEPASDTLVDYPEEAEAVDSLVEETVSNAMRDVELANSEASAESDPFDQFDQIASDLRHEASNEAEPAAVSAEIEIPAGDASVDDFFAEGFEDLLQDEISATREPVDPEPAIETSKDVELDFASAFEAELAADSHTVSTEPSFEPGITPEAKHESEQSELVLENDFAKAFADELTGESGQATVAQHQDYSFDGRIDPQAYADPQMLDDDVVSEQAVSSSGQSRGGFKLAVGALAAALVLGIGVVGWGYYSGQGGDGSPAIIKADTEPSKVKPEEPGGAEIANQDNEVYNQVAGTSATEPTQEELISSRPEPVDIQPKAESRLAPGAETASAETAPIGLSPKRVKTLTVKPDGTIVSSEGAIASAPTTATNTVSNTAGSDTASATPVAVNANAEVDNTSIGIDGAVSTGTLAIPEPSPLPAAQQLASVEPVSAPAPAPAAPKPAPVPEPTQLTSQDNAPAPTPVATSSEWKIQVSSQRSREAAESSFNNLQRRFSSILGNRSAVIQRADIEGKGTFYRAKVLAQSRNEASELCNRLKNAGGSCFVTR